MKKILLLASLCLPLLFSGCVKPIVDVTITIHGRVMDADTHLPLEGAIVWLSPSSYKKDTGSDGFFIFADIEQKQYTVYAQKEGYQPDHISVIAQPGETVEVSFLLKKEE